MEKKQYIEAGRIVNTHGVHGEVKIEVWLDSPAFMKRFKRLFIDGNELEITSAKVQKSFLIGKLGGIDDVNAAMALKNKTVFIARDDARLPAGSYFIQDIIGAAVEDESGRSIGILTDVLESPAQNIYVVRGETEHLIPAVPEFIMSTDLDKGLVTVHLIEGM